MKFSNLFMIVFLWKIEKIIRNVSELHRALKFGMKQKAKKFRKNKICLMHYLFMFQILFLEINLFSFK